MVCPCVLLNSINLFCLISPDAATNAKKIQKIDQFIQIRQLNNEKYRERKKHRGKCRYKLNRII